MSDSFSLKLFALSSDFILDYSVSFNLFSILSIFYLSNFLTSSNCLDFLLYSSASFYLSYLWTSSSYFWWFFYSSANFCLAYFWISSSYWECFFYSSASFYYSWANFVWSCFRVSSRSL